MHKPSTYKCGGASFVCSPDFSGPVVVSAGGVRAEAPSWEALHALARGPLVGLSSKIGRCFLVEGAGGPVELAAGDLIEFLSLRQVVFGKPPQGYEPTLELRWGAAPKWEAGYAGYTILRSESGERLRLEQRWRQPNIPGIRDDSQCDRVWVPVRAQI